MELDNTVTQIKALGDESYAPPLVDLTGAMTKGRRRRRTRRAFAGTISVVAVAAALAAVPAGLNMLRHQTGHPTPAPVAAGSPSTKPSATTPVTPTLTCVEQRLPTPLAGQQSVVTGTSGDGRHVLGRVYDAARHPTESVIWANRTIAHTIRIPGNDGSLVAMNASGVAVGSSVLTSNTNSELSWVYANGSLHQLPSRGDSEQAVGISDGGVIGGTETTPSTDQYPIVWSAATSEPKRLPLPGSTWRGQVEAVDADGTIVGTVSRNGSGDNRGIVWHPDGTWSLLPLPNIEKVNALQIDSMTHGVIIAEAEIVTKQEEQFIPIMYTLATGSFTKLPGADLFTSYGNSSGWLVGMVGNGNAKHPGNVPAVYNAGTGVIRLPRISTEAQPGNSAGWISEDGHLVTGQDSDSHGIIHAVEWHCQ